MLKSEEIRRQVAQRLRELLPKAKSWEEQTDVKIAGHAAGLVVRFRLVDQEHTVVLEVASLGQPRQIRAAVTRLADIRRELPGAYPVAAAVYIGPQSARILKSHNLGYVDLSGNCSLAFENVLIEKDGKRNVRPSTRPLRSLFPPRATRAFLSAIARAATAEGRRYAFTLNAGLSLVAPSLRVPAVHCYLEGDPAPVAAALGLRATAEGDGAVHFLAPYDPGVFHALLEKGGLTVVCLPQLYADLLRYERRGREQAEHLRREAMGY